MNIIFKNIAEFLPTTYLIALISIGFVYLIFKFYSRDNSREKGDRNVKVGSPTSLYDLIWKKQLPEVSQLEAVKKHGQLFSYSMLGKTAIMCTRLDFISQVLSKEFTTFTNRTSVFAGSDAITDNMLSLSLDDQWKRLRAIVSPTFSTGKLRKMRPLIDDCLQTLIKNIGKMSANSDHSVDMKTVYGAYTMEVIIQVAFGTKVDALIDDKNPIILNAKKLMDNVSLGSLPKLMMIMLWPKFAKCLGFTLFPQSVLAFFADLVRKIIAERRTGQGSDGAKRYDFLQLLLDANDRNNEENSDESRKPEAKDETTTSLLLNTKSLSDEEMISQCVLFFTAGYDTTANTMAYAIYLLTENPESQQKLFEESKSVIESKEDIDYDAIERLEYLNAVLMETHRLFPPVLILEREASHDITLTGDGGADDFIRVFKGDIIQIPVYALHKDPEQFKDPDQFKPERFLSGNIAHHPYAHLPFGAGPRNCVAKRLALMEAKLAILYSVYNYRFEISDKTSRPPKRDSNLGLINPKEVVLKVEKRVH
ncbi:unnamed protein product [Medioppia subpectinata]|uniref:Cytochrome P450 n=1 Tax=Medioppia subpectinata TaxID=1979941 RepID=A0A7R9Q838_9ACAR|nr:unnamed protein product [Medioppia subpectinata]CAG2116253.1 unnamed protein product [Medioppia subpectinata]